MRSSRNTPLSLPWKGKLPVSSLSARSPMRCGSNTSTSLRSSRGTDLGAGVLRRIMGESKDHRPFRLNVLQGSPARRLYERHGFVLETEDPVDVFMVAG